MRSVLILYNDSSGPDEKGELVNQLSRELLNSGMPSENISVLQPHSPLQALEFAREACRKKIDLVVAVGGDGTINPIAGGIYLGGGYSKLGILPAGSVNNLAKALKIPIDRKEALKNIYRGQARAIDICQVNDRFMISSLVLGTVAELTAGVTSKDKRKYGKLAFLKEAGRLFKPESLPLCRLKLTYKGGEHRIQSHFLLLAMTNSIAGFPILSPHIKPDNGLLSGYYTEEKNSPFFSINSFQASSLTIETLQADVNPEVRIDGDPSLRLPLTLTVIPRAVQVIVPLYTQRTATLD